MIFFFCLTYDVNGINASNVRINLEAHEGSPDTNWIRSNDTLYEKKEIILLYIPGKLISKTSMIPIIIMGILAFINKLAKLLQYS